jgi:hypothetical protein
MPLSIGQQPVGTKPGCVAHLELPRIDNNKCHLRWKEPVMTRSIPETPPDYDRTRIIERPDGFFWREEETGEEFGPFDTLIEAVQDMEYNAESEQEPGETLEEAERELGLSEWVDAETGELAEDTLTRIEDH